VEHLIFETYVVACNRLDMPVSDPDPALRRMMRVPAYVYKRYEFAEQLPVCYTS
jgi:hypothetical protein